MSTAHTFMIAGKDANDTELVAMIRSSLAAQPAGDRANWLAQIELGLDAYGDRHKDVASRVRETLRMLSRELGAVPT